MSRAQEGERERERARMDMRILSLLSINWRSTSEDTITTEEFAGSRAQGPASTIEVGSSETRLRIRALICNSEGKSEAPAEILTRLTQVSNSRPNSEQRLLKARERTAASSAPARAWVSYGFGYQGERMCFHFWEEMRREGE